MKRTGLLFLLALTLLGAGGFAQEPGTRKPALAVPAFDGKILGMEVQANRLGVVLDISESMKRSLPDIREALRQHLPRTPVLHVDGCGLERPDPRPRIVNGEAPDTVSAVALLGEHAGVTAVLWISDMGDPPNRAGIEAMDEVLAKHQIQLFLMSLKNKPGPSLRKLVEHTEGTWMIVPTKD